MLRRHAKPPRRHGAFTIADAPDTKKDAGGGFLSYAHNKLSFAVYVYGGCCLESPWGGGPVAMVLSPKTHLVSKKTKPT